MNSNQGNNLIESQRRDRERRGEENATIHNLVKLKRGGTAFSSCRSGLYINMKGLIPNLIVMVFPPFPPFPSTNVNIVTSHLLQAPPPQPVVQTIVNINEMKITAKKTFLSNWAKAEFGGILAVIGFMYFV